MQLHNTGIIAYGTALPAQKVLSTSIAESQGKDQALMKSLGVWSKTVPGVDEDAITLATKAAHLALSRLQGVDRQAVGALLIGSESHPYAVKPSGTVVKEALGLSDHLSLADLQFACKAGSQALQICSAYTQAGLMPAALAIGADTAQARPGDALEYTAAAGAAAFILGHGGDAASGQTNDSSQPKILARILASHSVATDTPDFWRKPKADYPEHFGRFTGEPAYFKHVSMATRAILEEVNLQVSDFDYCVFHTPNAKFPELIAKQLGFSEAQLTPSLVVREVGNTYAAASLLALAAVLDQAPAGAKILMCSYGSGAGADAFVLETTAELVQQRQAWSQLLQTQIAALKTLDITRYQQVRNSHGH